MNSKTETPILKVSNNEINEIGKYNIVKTKVILAKFVINKQMQITK